MAPAAPAKKKRCAWAGTDPLYVAYHDQEWGVPLHDDRLLFEFLVLEGAHLHREALERGRRLHGGRGRRGTRRRPGRL